MIRRTPCKCLSKLDKSLYLLVFAVTLCYSSTVYAHPPLQNQAKVHNEAGQRVTIELAEVVDLENVSRFTRILAENRQLADLRLSKVLLETEAPETSLVRWTALLRSGTVDDLEADLKESANRTDKFKLVHRNSHQSFLALAAVTAHDRSNENETPARSQSSGHWSIGPGHGFD